MHAEHRLSFLASCELTTDIAIGCETNIMYQHQITSQCRSTLMQQLNANSSQVMCHVLLPCFFLDRKLYRGPTSSTCRGGRGRGRSGLRAGLGRGRRRIAGFWQGRAGDFCQTVKGFLNKIDGQNITKYDKIR